MSVLLLLTVQGCAYLGRDYTINDAKARASEVSKHFSFQDKKVIKNSKTFSYATVNYINWTFHDDDFDFDFQVSQVWAMPGGLPPTRELRCDYYPKMLDAMFYSRPEIRAILTREGMNYSDYDCVCSSKEELCRNLDIMEQAIDDIREKTGVVAFGDYPKFDVVYIHVTNEDGSHSMYLSFDEREIDRERFINHLFPEEGKKIQEF